MLWFIEHAVASRVSVCGLLFEFFLSSIVLRGFQKPFRFAPPGRAEQLVSAPCSTFFRSKAMAFERRGHLFGPSLPGKGRSIETPKPMGFLMISGFLRKMNCFIISADSSIKRLCWVFDYDPTTLFVEEVFGIVFDGNTHHLPSLRNKTHIIWQQCSSSPSCFYILVSGFLDRGK